MGTCGNSSTPSEIVIAAFHDQAALCRKFGSDFTARVLEAFAHVADRSTALGERVLGWKRAPGAMGDALPLRVAAGLHALARSGRVPPLTAVYPANPTPTDQALRDALVVAVSQEDDWLTRWLAMAPQTNEVGRSALIYPGMMAVAARTGLPLSIFEIGTSAGLNLILDQYAYELGSRKCGDPHSSLVLAPDWTGPTPRGPMPRIVARRGCDLEPIDVTRSADAERLSAYIWPDQVDRHRRLTLAIELFRKLPAQIDRTDAFDWVRQRIGVSAKRGIARVLFHSLVISYLPEARRVAIAAHMNKIGQTACPESPLAWLSFELDSGNQPRLTLRMWPEGGEEALAEADPHGRHVRWLSEGR